MEMDLQLLYIIGYAEGRYMPHKKNYNMKKNI